MGRSIRHPKEGTRSFWKIGHRGAPNVAPENTLISFEKALKAGADMVEFDLTCSKDGGLFIFHDEKLNRSSNGKGKFIETSSKDIVQLDAGSWFGNTFKGEKIPTLREVLKAFSSKIALNIEIKKEAALVVEDIGMKVLEILDEQKLFESTVVSSFDHSILKPMRKNDQVRLAALFSSRPNEKELQDISNWGADFLHANVKRLDEKTVSQALKLGLPVRVYTVNDAKTLNALKAWGVDGVFTDDLSIF